MENARSILSGHLQRSSQRSNQPKVGSNFVPQCVQLWRKERFIKLFAIFSFYKCFDFWLLALKIIFKSVSKFDNWPLPVQTQNGDPFQDRHFG